MNRKEVLLLSIGAFLTVVAWLVADVYHASSEEKVKSKITVPQVTRYTIDTNILDALRSKTE